MQMRPLNFALSMALLAATQMSCADFGAGGTGETTISRERLRTIAPLPLEQLSADPPATVPAEVTTRPASQPAATKYELTLERVRELALRNNLDLRVELYNPALSEEQLRQEQARFESTFRTSIDYSTIDQATASQLSNATGNQFSVSPQIDVPLYSGGTLSVGVLLARSESSNTFTTLNPSATADPFVTITQPLLRSGGVDAAAHGIRVAFYRDQNQQAGTKLEVIRVLANADRAYWRLFASREARRVRQQEYELAIAQLDRARRQVKAGIAAEVEITRAESGVADQIEAIINADKDVRDNQRDLKRILNEPGLEMESRVELIPTSDPQPLFYKLDPGQMSAIAQANRMELLEAELALLEQAANIAFARNALLPLVNFQYTYGVNGLGGTFADAFSVVRDNRFTEHRFGVSIEVPLGNAAARSVLRQNLISRLQQLATKAQRSLTVRQEVLGACDTLDADWQRILAARQRVILAARTLDVEIRSFNQGVRTSTEVLEAQARLASARLAEVSAVADYQIAQVDIAFATGTLLGSARVMWEPLRAR